MRGGVEGVGSEGGDRGGEDRSGGRFWGPSQGGGLGTSEEVLGTSSGRGFWDPLGGGRGGVWGGRGGVLIIFGVPERGQKGGFSGGYV
jgi:hypothetical protein